MGETRPIVKEMSLTRDDFGRGLGSALASYDYRLKGDRVVIPTPGEDLTILFEALPPRRLGLNFTTPRARVTIAFGGLDPAQHEAFLGQFDRAFQRGGG